jgi:hypothetical protein
MDDLDSLAVDFIQLPPRALPEGWIAVTVSDVAEMLRQARVREPWHAPWLGCYSLAQCINNPLGYQSINSAGKTISKKHPGVNDGNRPERKQVEHEMLSMSCAGRSQALSRNSRAVLRNHSECTHRRLPEPSICGRSKTFPWLPRGARF